MSTGNSTYGDISTVVANIYEGALFTLKNNARLLPSVRLFNGNGLNPRTVPQYSGANPRTVGEGEDVTPTQFNKSALATLTPKVVSDQFLITDARMASDIDNVMRDGSIELGEAFADFIDADITANFANLTGGTVGTAGSALTWTHITNAQAILSANKARGMLWCVLHPYQWADLVASATQAGHSIASVQNSFNELTGVYFQSASIANAMFVVSSDVPMATNDATGAMYASDAIAFDIRKDFTIEAQRDASRQSTELNATMWYATNVLRPTLGVKIVSDASVPA